jgi:hypothetical protein
MRALLRGDSLPTVLRRGVTTAVIAIVASLIPAASAPAQAANPGVKLLSFDIPADVEKLRTEGAKARLRCRVDCRVTTKLTLPRRQANELGLKSVLIGKRSTTLEGDLPTTIRIELLRPARAALKGFVGEIDIRIASRAFRLG